MNKIQDPIQVVYGDYAVYEYPNKVKSAQAIQKKFKNTFFYFNTALKDIIHRFDSNATILELGCGYGTFAHFCWRKGFKNYTGIDFSASQLQIAKRQFTEYAFIQEELMHYLANTNKNFDIIYLGHILEHFDLNDQIKLLKLIKEKLNDNGILINIMVNADAYFKSGGLFGDITHKVVHGENSFDQILALSGFKKFIHRNNPVGCNFFANQLNRIAMFFFHYLVRLLGYNKQNIFSLHIVTIGFKD